MLIVQTAAYISEQMNGTATAMQIAKKALSTAQFVNLVYRVGSAMQNTPGTTFRQACIFVASAIINTLAYDADDRRVLTEMHSVMFDAEIDYVNKNR